MRLLAVMWIAKFMPAQGVLKILNMAWIIIHITIAVDDLHRDEWQQRSLTAIKLPFTISSYIGLWRMRSRQLTPSLLEMINMLKKLKSIGRVAA
jgi:hypothetical protein